MNDRRGIVLVDVVEPGVVNVYRIERDSPESDAALEWARYHGLNPCLIPAGSYIHRDAHRHTITYLTYVRGDDLHLVRDDGSLAAYGGGFVQDDGRTLRMEARVEQGEAGPLPFPTIITDPPPIRTSTRPGQED